jgi:iron complex transport system ATP-binding protein
MSDALLSLAGVDVTLGGRLLLDRISIEVGTGEVVAIVGPNGAGKTTLLRAAAGLIAATGTIRLGGAAVAGLSRRERARRVAYLPQGHAIYWPLPVADVVALGRLPRGAGADLSEADRLAVANAMAATGVTTYADRAVTTLSGGERARVALARVLATEAPLILADEPTTSLDPRYQLVTVDILRRHAAAGGGVVAVLHDLALAARLADRVILLHEGRVAAVGVPRDVLASETLAEAFGVTTEIVEVGGVPVPVPTAVNPNRARPPAS